MSGFLSFLHRSHKHDLGNANVTGKFGALQNFVDADVRGGDVLYALHANRLSILPRFIVLQADGFQFLICALPRMLHVNGHFF
ncbi:MAG: hypothetical protein IJ189_03870 [Clostridia bacterium]|nr:hypothetical protein [Clostridia bacterium]